MRILIVGCGFVGTALGAEWVKSGHEAWGLRRDAGAAHVLEKSGLKPITADLLRVDSSQIPEVDAVVFCQAPSRKNDEYRATYLEGTKNLLQVLSRRSAAVRKIILISSTSVYAMTDGSWVDESVDPAAGSHADAETHENARVLLAQEEAVLKSGFPAVVFRLAGIYGPGRNRVQSILDGRVKPVFSDIFMNRIHLHDIVRGMRLLLEKGAPGEIYLGADDAPCTQREFYTWAFEKLLLPLPEGGSLAAAKPAHGSNKRVSNKKIKALGLKLRYPTYREGYAPLIEEVLQKKDVRSGNWIST